MRFSVSQLRSFVRSCLSLNEDARTASALRKKFPFLGDDAAAMLSQAVWRMAADIARQQALSAGKQEAADDVKPVAEELAGAMDGAISAVSQKRLAKGGSAQPPQKTGEPAVSGKPGAGDKKKPWWQVQPAQQQAKKQEIAQEGEEEKDEGELSEEAYTDFPVPSSMKR